MEIEDRLMDTSRNYFMDCPKGKEKDEKHLSGVRVDATVWISSPLYHYQRFSFDYHGQDASSYRSEWFLSSSQFGFENSF